MVLLKVHTKKFLNGKILNKIEYLSAIEEEKYTIAQANSQLMFRWQFC